MEKETLKEAKHNCEGCQGKGYLDETDGYDYGKVVCPVCVNDKEPQQDFLLLQLPNIHHFLLASNKNEYCRHDIISAFNNGANWQAERIALMEIELNHTKTLLASCEKALEDRDKKAERMYSEEELLQALNLGFTSTDETWEQCVAFAKEQFKKK